MAALGAVSRILVLVLFTIAILPLHLTCLFFFPKMANRIAHVWHMVSSWALNISVSISGTPQSGPVLYLCNHASWLDIVALSRAAPLSFVAKADVASWPIFSWLAKWQRTIFVERDKRSRTGVALGAMVNRLENGDALVLFPEGTSSEGWHVLPFKSALIGAVVETASKLEDHDADLFVQPVALAYTKLQGIPLGRMEAERAAWIGDIDLLPHLWSVLMSGRLEANIVFGQPVEVNPDTNRKMLTRDMEAEVASLLEQARH
ncbi:MAG: lysophospholipid acyltransferase family protein [Hyphomicrobiales bacterium]